MDKGNHDLKETIPIYGFPENRNYYIYDFKKTRIIVLDNTEIYDDYYGGFKNEQLEWLRQNLNVRKNIIIVMHVPVFAREEQGGMFMQRYETFENLIRQSRNVKLVLAGHFHKSWKKNYKGITYEGLTGLTIRNNKGWYGIINTKDYSAAYKQIE